MRKLYSVIFVLLCISVNAQNNVGIGILSPDQSAILHLQSDNKGLLVPRLTTAERTAISAPANGLLVYDTDATCFFFFRNSTWESLCAANTSALGMTGMTGYTGPTGTQGLNGIIGVTGNNGEIGVTGATGNNGTNGVIGVTGATGNNGNDGAVGVTGSTGNNGTIGGTGSTGNNGNNGAVGVTGTTGNNGTNGTTGVTGATGNNGTNGNNGAIGVTGATGNNGNNGPIGVTGPTGNNGSNGATGATGSNGTNGNNGAIGVTGATGNNGNNGPIGVTGSTGNNGNNGAVGVTGTTGNNGSNGTTGATGNNGTNGNNGAIGVTGATGNNGNNGTIGVTGSTGNNGINGATGVTGNSGNNGEIGITGVTGNIGSTGFTGTIGATGSTGTIGVTGNTGNIGSTGFTGAVGITGFTGTIGATGSTGTIGVTGNTGNIGSTGFTGAVGTTGLTGTVGETGSTGAIGVTGNTGNIGSTGFTGAVGITGFTGTVGATGSTGTIGMTGNTGNIGSTGFTGAVGTTGFTGTVGETGSTGAIGVTGNTGNIGSTGFTGAVGTTGATGEVGATGPVGCTGTNFLLKSTGTSSGCTVAPVFEDNSGKVGIGTSIPGEKLEVNGNIKYTGRDLITGAVQKITVLYIRGTGLNNNANRSVRLGSTELVSNTTRGLNLIVISKADHSVISNTTYDTYGLTSESDNLATAINAMTNAQIGILTSADAWENAVSANLKAAFKRLGLYKALNTGGGSRRPYAAIFEPSSSSAAPSDHAVEIEYSDNSNEPHAELRGWLIDGGFSVSGSQPSALSTPLGANAANVTEGGVVQINNLSGSGNRIVYADNSGNLAITSSTADPANLVDGVGTLNYIPKWTPDGNSLGNSQIYDNGTAVGINTANPAQGKLWVQGGDIWATGDGTKLAFSTDGSTDATPNASVIALQNSISGASADLIFKIWNGTADAEIMRVRSNGNVGIGTASPQSLLHVMGKTNIHQSGAGGGQNRFEGLETTTSANGRAQLVLSSAYSDLIIASSQANDNHGSTLTFATYNPSNAGDFRKWIVNQGNWGLRSQFMDFGYATNITNPHSAIGSGTTTFTLDGSGRKAGIRMINPLVPLEVGHNGAESYGIGSLINQYAVGNSDGPKLGFRKLNNTGPTNKDWSIGIANGVDVTRFGINEDGGVGGFGTERFTILAGGNVGIGQTNPGHKLEVYGADNVAYFVSSGANAYIRLAINNDIAQRVELANRNGRTALWNPTTQDAFNIVHASGNVGVGTTNPVRGKLEVVGSGSNITNNYWWLISSGPSGPCNSCTAPYSIYADGRIASPEFNAFSDERIKNIKGVSDAANDLQIISHIEITDYTLKDTIARGTKTYKKVIAQQVEKVYPQAITISTDIVPNIYRVAEIHNGWISLKTNLKAGERVKLIFENREEITDVKEISAEGFKVTAADSGKVFVYGTEVSDFRSVDYEAISMLNVSATQELAKQLAELKKQTKNVVNQDRKLEEQQKQIDRLVEENKQLVEQLNELKRLFGK